jgi:hypothetical protein
LQLGKAKGAFPGNDPGTKSFAPLYGEDEGSLIEGGSELATRIDSQEKPDLGSGLGGSSAPDLPTPVESDPEGDTTGRSRGGTGNRRGARGGILVAYDNLGPDEHRAKFVRENRTVMINLDHPQVTRALARSGSNVEDDSFVQLSWDVAITEYAVALARMRDDAGHYGDVYEPLFDIRDAIDRLTRLA